MLAITHDTTESYLALRGELAHSLGASSLDLPLLPEAVQRVLAATADESCDARALADLIRSDPALAGQVLKIANSPLYAGVSPTISLQQAVARLGMRQIRDIALLISMKTRLFSVRGFEGELRSMFLQATAAGLFAQEIARTRRMGVEDAFLAGLFHDVGKPVVLQAMIDARGESARAVEADRPRALSMVEDLHMIAGAALARAWSLAPSLADVIGHHHDPQASSSAILMVRLADELACQATGVLPVCEAALLTHPAAEGLNLYPEDLRRLVTLGPEIAKKAGAT